MRRERDKHAVRTVGAICLGLGLILVPLTLLVTAASLLTTAGRTGDIARGFLAFVTPLIMGSTLLACGTQLQSLRLFTDQQITNMRMAWTGILLVMVAGGGVAVWANIPGLVYLAAFVLCLLIIIRPSVIRLSE
ncbi:MAG: hypothetical protein K0S68_1063 [Candidatus Saccharibacteria bacterium]|jgi:hypothetical protein|nr:hypothetical protein [Candidatus Saccharibacteria bacterium]